MELKKPLPPSLTEIAPDIAKVLENEKGWVKKYDE
jgi:hypothetical protein